MKTRLFPWLTVVVASLGILSGLVKAQDQPAGGGKGARLAFLSADDRAHLLRVRQQVLTDNPDLKTEQESLAREWQFVRGKGTDASADDKETLRNNFMAHNEKMNAAMVKADPSVQPILDQVKQHMKDRFASHAESSGGADQNSGNP